MGLKVRMIGYNAKGQVVYTDCLDTGDYYDGEHVWDRTESILRLNLVKVIGEKFDIDGNISETWETAFSAETGEYIGSIGTDSDGIVKRESMPGWKIMRHQLLAFRQDWKISTKVTAFRLEIGVCVKRPGKQSEEWRRSHRGETNGTCFRD